MRPRAIFAVVAGTVLILALAAGLDALPKARAALKPIQRENAKPGTTGWEIKVLSYHGEIQGYASAAGVSAGHSISFSVSTTAARFRADVYRMGWYDGDGARLMTSVTHLRGHLRSRPKPDSHTGMIVCHWPVSFRLTVPASWVSGVYMVKLTGSNTHQAYIPFVVTDPSSRSTYLFVHAVFTDEAYNTWGGKSLYADISYPTAAQQYAHRAVEVSFERPFVQNMGAGWFFSWEIHMVRWLEQRGYDVDYGTDLDVANRPALLLRHRAVLVVGHDEYWTRGMRNAYDEAVAHGVGLGNFAANSGFWQIRLESLGRQADAAMVCYKTSRDPLSERHPKLTTTEFRSPPLNRPEQELTGAMYGAYEGAHGPSAWVVSRPKSWVFRGTHMRRGAKIPKVLGQEVDWVYHRYPRPHGVQILAHSPLLDSGNVSRVANATVYRARSGAWVFDAGAIEWSWGLDDLRQSFWLYKAAPKHPNHDAEIITANVLAAFSRGRR